MGAIYRITHKASGTTYVGSTADVKRRRGQHRCALRHDTHSNPHLQSAFNKYGKEAFEWAILEDGLADKDLAGREQFWLDEYRRHGKVYNYGECAANNRRGVALSAETCRKMSEANKGKNNPQWGRPLSEEHRRKIGKAHRGKTLSAEHRRRFIEGRKGKALSVEHRRKIGEANTRALRGRKLTEEHKRKISEALRQHWAQRKDNVV